MNYLLIFIIIISFVSCASHNETEKHHHHPDVKSIPLEDHGNGQFMIKHGGEVFYFDSEEDFLKFEEKLKRNKARTKCVRRGRQLVCSDQ